MHSSLNETSLLHLAPSLVIYSQTFTNSLTSKYKQSLVDLHNNKPKRVFLKTCLNFQIPFN